MPLEEVLLFSGIPSMRGGSSVLGRRHCTRKKRVYSKANRKYVMRCANFSGGKSGKSLGSMGALPFNIEQLKGTLLTGAVAVGGAIVAGKAVAYLAPMIKIVPGSKWIMALEVIVGLLGGYAVARFAKQPDLGAAVALGPVIVNGLRIVGPLLTPAGAPVAGAPVRASQPLGVTVPAGQLPEWMWEDPYLQETKEQNPAWAM